jgi:hypothetical protein
MCPRASILDHWIAVLLSSHAGEQEEAMFISKQRPIAIPQWEHQKLAGTLALLWGNAEFERPLVPFESFLTGIGLHDRAYGRSTICRLERYPRTSGWRSPAVVSR